MHMDELARSIQSEQEQATDANGRYPCRFPGCTKTFAHDGKLRKDHEDKHVHPVLVEKSSEFVLKSKSEDKASDDMLSYEKALLDYGMLFISFWDSIAEGDGYRNLCCWKFFLIMYLKHQEFIKYALEALYLMYQVNALLSPQASHPLIWNRFVKNKPGIGGNVPFDLQLEFYDKYVKEAIKKLGPSVSVNSLDRICLSLGTTKAPMNNFDEKLSVFKRSGRDVKRSSNKDLLQIVNELVENRAIVFTTGRRYGYYRNMPPSILTGFNMEKMFSWITDHKIYMLLHRRAR